MHIHKKTILYTILCTILFLSVGILSGFINEFLNVRNLPELSSDEGREKFRQFDVAAEYLAGQENYGQLAEDYLYHNGSLNGDSSHRYYALQ